MKYIFRLVSTAVILSLSAPLFSQMTDWFFYKDRAGNGYYYDRAFRIRITGEKKFSFEPVSAGGADFYFNTGVDLVKSGRMVEGLYYLKSLRILKPGSARIERIRNDATECINTLYKKQGDRFEDADRESTVLLTADGSLYDLVNDKLFYRMNFSSRPYIIKNGWKESFSGYGLKLGINAAGSTGDGGYDYMIGIETRIYTNALESLAETEKALYGELVFDALRREILLRQDDRVIYYYEYMNDAPFCGIEGVFFNGRIVHLVRGICHKTVKEQVIEEMKKNITGLVLVKNQLL